MLRTFNCGIGMILVVAKDSADAVLPAAHGAGEKPDPHRRDRARPRRQIAGQGQGRSRGRALFGQAGVCGMTEPACTRTFPLRPSGGLVGEGVTQSSARRMSRYPLAATPHLRTSPPTGWGMRERCGDAAHAAHEKARRHPDLRARLQHDGAGRGGASAGLSGRDRARSSPAGPTLRAWPGPRRTGCQTVAIDHKAYAIARGLRRGRDAALDRGARRPRRLAGFMRIQSAAFVAHGWGGSSTSTPRCCRCSRGCTRTSRRWTPA